MLTVKFPRISKQKKVGCPHICPVSAPSTPTLLLSIGTLIGTLSSAVDVDLCFYTSKQAVIITYLDAKTHFPLVIPNVLPQLNPSHPHHSMKVPSKTLVGDAMVIGRPGASNFPRRGLR